MRFWIEGIEQDEDFFVFIGFFRKGLFGENFIFLTLGREIHANIIFRTDKATKHALFFLLSVGSSRAGLEIAVYRKIFSGTRPWILGKMQRCLGRNEK